MFWRACGLAAVLASPALHAAEAYPAKTIRLILPFGVSEILYQLLTRSLSETLGQPVVIDYKPGNGGHIGAEAAAKSPADGYTLIILSSAHTNGPSMYANLNYDVLKDFAPISLIARVPQVLVVHPSLPVKSVREFMVLAKARPGQLNYAAGTIGATPHLAGEQFKIMAGVNVVRVPYKGSGPGLIGLMSGEVEFMFPGAASAWNYVKQGRLKGLAICSLKPSPLFPGVATLSESGLPGYESVSPQGVVAPAKTPAAIVARLNQELVKALNRADVKQRLGDLGIEVVANTPDEYLASMKNDIARTSKLIKDAGIRAE